MTDYKNISYFTGAWEFLDHPETDLKFRGISRAYYRLGYMHREYYRYNISLFTCIFPNRIISLGNTASLSKPFYIHPGYAADITVSVNLKFSYLSDLWHSSLVS